MEPLSETCKDLCGMLAAHIEGIDAAGDEPEKLVHADAVCTYYQGVAICELLLDAEVDAFFHHLIRSAQTRRWLLQRWSRLAGGQVADVAVASNTRGLFAAMIARQWGLAADVARLSPAAPALDTEYEEDFCYAHLLHLLVLGAPAAERDRALARFATTLDGGESVRHDLCRHLLARSAAGCASSFAALLEERAAELEKAKRSVRSRDSLFRPFSAVYVEGLAWLALLDREGIPTEPEYTFCPSLARAASYAPFQASTFPSVPL